MHRIETSDRPEHKCGVAGAVLAREGLTAFNIFHALRALQHRGQESAGIATYDIRAPNSVQLKAGMGLVHEVFNEKILEGFTGTIGIGHVRYATSGASSFENVQPIKIKTTLGEIALAHNGDIVNAHSVRSELAAAGVDFRTTSDSEVIIKAIGHNMDRGMDIIKAIRSVMKRIWGSYSIVMIVPGRLIAFRDPQGIRPLAIGRIKDGYMVASESVAFNALSGRIVRDVIPGEIVEVGPNRVISHPPETRERYAHCMFEYVYFARPDSIIDGRQVYDVRINIGKVLAHEQPASADVIVPVPDSGRAHALGYSMGSGIQFSEGLIKNRYIARTFIMPSGRKSSITHKLNVVSSVVEGRRVVLVDDSIVRGNTMERMVSLLRDFGATEVHVRIGSPPIMWPCYLGIDMKSRGEFVAREAAEEAEDMDSLFSLISKRIGADSVGYLSIDGLMRAIGLKREDLCLGCLTGRYPVPIPGEKTRSDDIETDIDWLSHYDERGQMEKYTGMDRDSRSCG